MPRRQRRSPRRRTALADAARRDPRDRAATRLRPASCELPRKSTPAASCNQRAGFRTPPGAEACRGRRASGRSATPAGNAKPRTSANPRSDNFRVPVGSAAAPRPDRSGLSCGAIRPAPSRPRRRERRPCTRHPCRPSTWTAVPAGRMTTRSRSSSRGTKADDSPTTVPATGKAGSGVWRQRRRTQSRAARRRGERLHRRIACSVKSSSEAARCTAPCRARSCVRLPRRRSAIVRSCAVQMPWTLRRSRVRQPADDRVLDTEVAARVGVVVLANPDDRSSCTATPCVCFGVD